MENIKKFMGILLIICLSLCIDYKKIDGLIKEYHHSDSLSLLGLEVENFKGRVRVRDVIDYTPAKYSGIEPGDKIIEINGEKIKNVQDFINSIENAHDKEKIKLLVYRVDSNSLFPVEVSAYGEFQ